MNANHLLDKTLQKIDGAYAPATIRAYRADFNDFIGFCESRGETALPGSPQAVADFISLLIQRGKRSSSIRRAIAGIASIHNLSSHRDPTKHVDVRLALRRMHRQLGRYNHQAHGITREILEKMISSTENSLRGARNRALLLVAYDTLCRRSELLSMRVEDIKIQHLDRLRENYSTAIFLSRSKTDQEAQGRWLRISQAASLALDEWLEQSGILVGPIFRGVNRSGKLTDKLDPGQISRIYKNIAKSAQLDCAVIAHISGHSTRVGAAQDLLLSGASLPMIMSRGRWSKSDTVMRYVERVGVPI